MGGIRIRLNLVHSALLLSLAWLSASCGADGGAPISPTSTPQTTTQTSPTTGPPLPSTGVIGPVLAVRPSTIVVQDGEGDHEVAVTPTTIIIKAAGSTVLEDNNLNRVRVNDAVTVAGTLRADGVIEARQISVNFYSSRQVEIVGVNGDEVRAKISLNNGEDPIVASVTVSPSATVDARTDRPFAAAQLTPGQKVHLQAYRRDDGSFIAVSIDRGS